MGGRRWAQSSGTWGVYRFDYVFVSIRTSRRSGKTNISMPTIASTDGALGCGGGRPPARRPRGDRRPRHVLGSRSSPVHGAVERLQPRRPPGEGARHRAGRPRPRRAHRRRGAGGRARPAGAARARRDRRRNGPARRRRRRRRAARDARHDGSMAAPPPPRRDVGAPSPGPRDRRRGQHVGADPGAAVRAVRRGDRAPSRRRAGAEHRAAVRRGPPAARRRRPPAGRTLVDPPRRARRTPPAAAPTRVGPAPGPRPRGAIGRRPARGRSGGRRRPPARHPRRRRARCGDRPGNRRAASLGRHFTTVHVPELPPRGRRPDVAPPAGSERSGQGAVRRAARRPPRPSAGAGRSPARVRRLPAPALRASQRCRPTTVDQR